MWTISSKTLDDILYASDKTYPNEFFSMLGGDRKTKYIDELILVPAVYGDHHTIIKPHLVPFDERIVGTIHSHPSENFNPSKADLNAFSKLGSIHLIVAYPYNLNTIKAFNHNGEKQTIKVI